MPRHLFSVAAHSWSVGSSAGRENPAGVQQTEGLGRLPLCLTHGLTCPSMPLKPCPPITLIKFKYTIPLNPTASHGRASAQQDNRRNCSLFSEGLGEATGTPTDGTRTKLRICLVTLKGLRMGTPTDTQGVALQSQAKPASLAKRTGQGGPEEEAAQRIQLSWDSGIPRARVQTQGEPPASQCSWASSFTSLNLLPHLLIFLEQPSTCLAPGWTLLVKYIA